MENQYLIDTRVGYSKKFFNKVTPVMTRTLPFGCELRYYIPIV